MEGAYIIMKYFQYVLISKTANHFLQIIINKLDEFNIFILLKCKLLENNRTISSKTGPIGSWREYFEQNL